MSIATGPVRESKPERMAPTRREVILVGQASLHNSILASFLGNSGGFPCRIVGPSSLVSPHAGAQALYLLDASKVEDCLPVLSSLLGFVLTALINISCDDSHCEKIVLANHVHGVFPSQCAPEQLLQGIQAIFNGEYWLPRRLLTGLLLRERERLRHVIPSADVTLTSKERKILDLLSKGHSNDVIANQLRVSAHTVKTHLYNIYKKINVNNRIQAVIWAQENRGHVDRH